MFRKPAPPPPPRRSWFARAAGWVIRVHARLAGRLIALSARYGWRYRRLLTPVYVSMWLAVAAVVLRHSADAVATAATAAGIAAACLAARIVQRRRRRKPLRRRKLVYAWTCWAAATGWLLTLITVDMPAMWAAAVHLTLTTAAAVPWAWNLRVRKTPGPSEAVRIYDERLAAEGRRLAGTVLTNVQPGEGNVEWSGIIRGEPGLFVTGHAVAAQPYVASAYQRAGSAVIIEPDPTETLDTARLLMVRSNAAYTTNHYDESWHGIDRGSVQLTVYPDGQRGRLAVWVPGAGTRHALYSGDTSSGKSKGMTAAVTQVTRTGLAVPWFGCPQGGQSSPAWAGLDGLADYIARTPVQCVEMLVALREGLNARSAYLAKLPYLLKGKVRHGVARYDPDLTVIVDGVEMPLGQHMPILDVTVDEIPQVFDVDPGVKYLVAEIVKLGSKAGGRLSIATQMPIIVELGGLDTIRQNIKAGNVVAFRNGEMSAKDMVLSPWMPSPWSIPKHPPGRPDEHTLGTCVLESVAPGSSRATFSRTVLIEDDFEEAEEADAVRPPLDEITAAGIGGDYYRQWKERPKAPKTVRPAPATPPAPPAEPTTVPAPAAQERETITVTAAQPAGGPRAGTVAARAIAFLAGRKDPATTGTIAAALDVPRAQVSQSLGRELNRAGSPVRRGPGKGTWTVTRQQIEAAA